MNLLTKLSAVSATSRQPWSIVREWPRFGIFTISVTPGLRLCRPTLVIAGVVGLCLLLVARGYAVSSLHSLQGQPTPTSTEASRLSPKPTGASHSIGGIGAVSQRELEVARLASRGRTAPDIGRILHIGERTVETHIAHTYAKLHIQSKAQLIGM